MALSPRGSFFAGYKKPKRPPAPRIPSRPLGGAGRITDYGTFGANGVITPAAGPGAPAAPGGGYRPTLLTPQGSAPSFAPLQSDQQLQTQAAGYVSAQIDPVLKQISDMINRRGTQGAEAIGQLTGQYANALKGYGEQLPGIYGPAKQQLATTTQALADRISGVGAQTGQGLAAVLAQAGQTDAGGVSPAQLGQGAGTAAFATGTSALDELIAREAAARTNAAQQPGFAYGMGDQQLGLFQRALANQLADQTGQVTSQVPGLTQGILRDLTGARSQEQGRRDQLTQNYTDYTRNLAQANAQTLNEAQKTNLDLAQQKRTNNLTWAQYLQDLAGKKSQATGQVWDVVPGPYGRGGIRPHDVNPRKPGVQPQQTLSARMSQQAAALAAGKTLEPIPSSASRTSKNLIDRYGNVIGKNPNYVPPTPKAKTPAKVDLALSKAAGRWLDTSGHPVAGIPGKPPAATTKTTSPKVDVSLSRALGYWADQAAKPVASLRGKKVPQPAKDAPKVDLDLSISMRKWVDSSGRAIASLRGRPVPNSRPGTGGTKAKAKGQGGAFDPATGKYG